MLIGSQLLRASFENVNGLPATGDKWQIVYDSVTDAAYIYKPIGGWTSLTSVVSSSTFEILPYTEIKEVGEVGQLSAGYRPLLADDASTLALYSFANGSLLTDATGNYNLSNIGLPAANASGIFNDAFGVTTTASDGFENSTLLDVMPAALAIDFWFKASFAGGEGIMAKEGLDPNNSFTLALSSGQLVLTCKAIGNTTTLLSQLPGLNNDLWHYCAFTWDTTNGIRLFVDGILIDQDSAATTLMTQGTSSNFILAKKQIGTVFIGDLYSVRIRNKVLSKEDVSMAYSSKITLPVGLIGKEFAVIALVKDVNNFVKEISFSDIECCRTNNYIYKLGGVTNLESTDELKLYGTVLA